MRYLKHCFTNTILPRLVRRSLLFLVICLFYSESVAQENNALELSKARIKFYLGEINSAIAATTELLKNNELAKLEKFYAYELLGLCYLARHNQEEEAETVIRKIFGLNKDYEPVQSVLITPEYIELVKKVRKQLQLTAQEKNLINDQEKLPSIGTSRIRLMQNRHSKWPWLVAGAGVAGGVAMLLAFGGADANSSAGFPAPPVRPSGN